MYRLFFLFFLLLGFSSLYARDFPSKEQAERLFESGLYQEAGKVYDALLAQGQYSEKMLYRMAYIAEHTRQTGNALFYLRKIEREYGGDEVKKRIDLLVESLGAEGDMAVHEGTILSFLARHPYVTWGAILVSLAITIVVIRKKIRGLYAISLLSLVLLSGLLALFLLTYQTIFQEKSCVLTRLTGFYEAPSFGAAYQNNILSPGSVLRVENRSDIWYEIRYNQKSYWIPHFVVREL